MQIKEIFLREEIAQSFFLLTQYCKNLDEQKYIDDFLSMIKNGYKAAILFDKANPIAFIGIRSSYKLQHKLMLEIEDFFIDKNLSDQKFDEAANALISWSPSIASGLNCQKILVNFSTERKREQKNFASVKFLLEGFSFSKISS